MNDAQARALIAAGRLLQSKAWPGSRVKIEKREGETYLQAVSRAISKLDDGDRDHLRGLVVWVLEYERTGLSEPPTGAGSITVASVVLK